MVGGGLLIGSGVEGGVSALDVEGAVALCTEDVEDGRGEGFLDEGVEAGRADGDEDVGNVGWKRAGVRAGRAK